MLTQKIMYLSVMETQTKKRCKICSKLKMSLMSTIKVMMSIINNKDVIHVVLVSLLSTLNRSHTVVNCKQVHLYWEKVWSAHYFNKLQLTVYWHRHYFFTQKWQFFIFNGIFFSVVSSLLCSCYNNTICPIGSGKVLYA